MNKNPLAFPVGIKPIRDESFLRALNELARLKVECKGKVSNRVSDRFASFLGEFLLGGIEIKRVDLPAVGTFVSCGIAVSKDHLKFLAALSASCVTAEGEIPLHGDAPI